MMQKGETKEGRVIWICSECAYAHGGHMPPWEVATFHDGTCDVCQQEKTVTEPRDYNLSIYLMKRSKSAWK